MGRMLFFLFFALSLMFALLPFFGALGELDEFIYIGSFLVVGMGTLLVVFWERKYKFWKLMLAFPANVAVIWYYFAISFGCYFGTGGAAPSSTCWESTDPLLIASLCFLIAFNLMYLLRAGLRPLPAFLATAILWGGSLGVLILTDVIMLEQVTIVSTPLSYTLVYFLLREESKIVRA
ncbi:MAG: hypothetical protein Q8P99_00210 [bacterium]|nr:hypothetical protein [bacterium]